MSDIKRYLRCARSGDMRPDSHGAWCKYDEAADEIERLRGEAERKSRIENERSQRAVEMETEIERLRELAYFYPAPARIPVPWSEEAARLRGELYRANRDIGMHNAEIERLRDELRERLSQDILDDALEEWKKENERLREENALLTKGWQPATPTALLDEIERLRGLADVARLDVMWQELVRERDDAKQEIERLREALEFVLEAARWHFDGDADPKNESPEDMTAHINGLIVKRVREALGE